MRFLEASNLKHGESRLPFVKTSDWLRGMLAECDRMVLDNRGSIQTMLSDEHPWLHVP